MKLWERHYRFCAAPGAWAATAAAAFVALLLAAWAPQARAQGARKDDVVINSAGQPVGGASIAVCNSTATIGTSTTPCSPLATIYTDATLATPAANPFTADGLGNYGFWAPPGTYQVQLYGTQITTTLKTVVLPCVPGSSCAGGGASSPNAAMKPGASDAIQYVSPNGNDSNDGLSIGTAKLTIMAAYDALGQGGGTIYISGSSTSGVYCTSTAGQGIWIMGSADPNYSSPPAGWRKMKLGGPVYFVGLSANTSPAASTTSWTTVVNCGNNTNPGVWLSGVSGVTISRLRMVSESVRVSMDSNGGRNNATNPSAQIEFDHDDFRSDCSSCGPAMDVGGNMLWLNVHDSTFENGAIANWSVSANSSQASNISISNGGGSGPIGLLYFTQNFFSGGGGLRFDANTNNTASVYAAHTLMEGAGSCQPVYEIINGGTFAATFDLQGGFSDCGASPPFVKVAAGNQPCQTSVRGINQGGQVPGLEGPLTVGDAICPSGNPSGGVSVSDAGVPSAGVIPAAKGQSGGAYGTSQYADSYRRSFAPSLVRFANTANQLPSTWTAYQGSGQTLTPIQGPGDPAGSTNAATLSCTGQSGFGCSYYVFDSNITFNAGDYVYVGAWMQAASTAGFGNGSAIGVIFPFANGPTMRQMTGGPAGVGGAFSGGTTQLSSSPYLQNDGNWQYVWGLSKVTTPFGGASGTIFSFAFQPGYPINVYAPMFVRIPASSVAVVSPPTFSSASEAGNIVTFTTSAAHNLSRGEPIVVSGCSVSGYNGEFVLGNTISSTTFTVYNSATGLGSPAGCVITPENDSEVADWANNVKSYSDKCSTGVLCGVVSNPAISASGLNNIVFVDGVTYPKTDAGIQAALNALPSGNGTIFLPDGLYTLSGTGTEQIKITGTHVNFICSSQNAVLQTQASVPSGTIPMHWVPAGGNVGSRIQDCSFSDLRASPYEYSIQMDTSPGNNFDELQIDHIYTPYAIWLNNTGAETNGGFFDSTIEKSIFNLITCTLCGDSLNIGPNNLSFLRQNSDVWNFTFTPGSASLRIFDNTIEVPIHFGSATFAPEIRHNEMETESSSVVGSNGALLDFDGTSSNHVQNAVLVNNSLQIVNGSTLNGVRVNYGGVRMYDNNFERGVGATDIVTTANSCGTQIDFNFWNSATWAQILSDASNNGCTLSSVRQGIPNYGMIWTDGTGTTYLGGYSSNFLISGNNGASYIYDGSGANGGVGNIGLAISNNVSSIPVSSTISTVYNLALSALLMSKAAPTISSGFGTSPSIVQQNGTAAFEVNVGTGGSATSGVIGLPTAANGWSCTAIDMNTNIVTRETAFTTTTVTLTAASAWTASDKLLVNCAAF